MIPHPDIYISEHDCLELYVVGYQHAGESIIVKITDQFVGVIDCYRLPDAFVTKQILLSAILLRTTIIFIKMPTIIL